MPHYLPLPNYGVELLSKQMCIHCASSFTRDRVTQIGICLHQGRHYFFYSVICGHCQKPVNVVVTTRGEMTVERIANEAGGQVPQPIGGAIPGHMDEADESWFASTEPPDDGISEQEVADLMAALDKAQTYEELLRAIGLTQAEIDQYMNEE